jgi:hypothetical protein
VPATNFYPTLSTIIPVENIPESMGFIRTGLNNIFDHLYYKDLQIDRSVAGEA